MNRVLIVEDEAALREILRDYLTAKGYETAEAADGEEALRMQEREGFDLILLDVMMPGPDGFSVLRRLRQEEAVPVIFLTARGAERDQLTGYGLGADDYVVKPFSLPVLLAKIQALLRRGRGMVRGEAVEAGGIRLEPDRRRALAGGQALSLAPMEYELLLYLMLNRGRVLSRDQLVEHLWGLEFDGSDRAVDTHIKRLRAALGPYRRCIRTVIKAGYSFRDDFRDERIQEAGAREREGDGR